MNLGGQGSREEQCLAGHSRTVGKRLEDLHEFATETCVKETIGLVENKSA